MSGMDWRFVLYAADGSVRLDVPAVDGPLPQPITIEEGDLGFFVYRGNPVHLRPGDRIERIVGWEPQPKSNRGAARFREAGLGSLARLGADGRPLS